MGSSKKHKDKDREHKHKRHHRSRSRSRERHRKDKKHRRRDESEEGSPPPAPRGQGWGRFDNAAPSEDREWSNDAPSTADDSPKNIPNIASSANAASSSNVEEGQGAGLSLSIEETNKLRISLGLKPLDVSDSTTESKSENQDVHAPAVNLAEVKRTEDLREKMLQIKEKRRINQALGKVKKLADDSDDESAASWVKKSRKIETDRQKAEQMAKMLEDMDSEFNLGSLVAEEFAEKKKMYDSKDLRGLRVEHAQDSFVEGRTTILVLKDKGILEEEDPDDTLVNMNMLDDEHAKRNIENKKKKPDYKPYDEPEFDEFGMIKPIEVLDKYDEEIHGKKKESFELGGGGRYNAEHERRMKEYRSAVQQQGEALTLPAPKIASEYYTTEEMASFKKPRKKPKTLRKKTVLKADDLLSMSSGAASSDHGSRSRRVAESSAGGPSGSDSVKIKSEISDDMDIDDDVINTEIKLEVKPEIDDDEDDVIGPSEDLSGYMVDEESSRRDLELALNKTRRLKSAEQRSAAPLEKRVKMETRRLDDDDEDSLPFKSQEFESSADSSSNIVLYSTSEFCRTLGDMQSRSANQDEDDMDLEAEYHGRGLGDDEDDDEMGTGAWQSVEIDSKPVEIKADEKPVLDDEPVLTGGLAGALKLAHNKGYLDNKLDKISSAASRKKIEIEAANYSIEDKRYDDLDEKYNRKRDRYAGGSTMEFREKEGYKPDFKLEYTDDQGKNVHPKEAFRLLSHRFHGKGSGKKKTEKRMKKLDEEQLMLMMNSTDTPLNTVHMLKERQKVEKTPYIVLSGGKGMASSMLAK